MVIAEVRAAQVPVEVLGLQIKREHVRQDGVHGSRDVPSRISFKVSWGDQWNFLRHFSRFIHNISLVESSDRLTIAPVVGTQSPEQVPFGFSNYVPVTNFLELEDVE